MWNAKQIRLLVAILDQFVPANPDKGIPSAGALGVVEFFPKAQAFAPDPVGSITRVLDTVEATVKDFVNLEDVEKVAVLKAVEAAQADDFALLIRLTYMGYYSRPEIRPFFGVAAHPVHPTGYKVPREAESLMAELTAPVRNRGPIYRDF